MSLRDSLEFDKELHSLYEIKLPVSASKISALTKLAVKHAKLYKNVVFSIEKFVQKCPSELKLAGLYVIDSIARAIAKHPEEGESYIARFEEKLDSIIPHLMQAPPKDKDRIKRTIGLWKKSGLFNVNLVSEWEQKYLSDGTDQAASTPPASSDPRLENANSTPADPRLAGAPSAVAPASTPQLNINASALGGLDPSILGALAGLNSGAGNLDLVGLLPQLMQAQAQQAQQTALQNPVLNQLTSLLQLSNGPGIPGLSGLVNQLGTQPMLPSALNTPFSQPSATESYSTSEVESKTENSGLFGNQTSSAAKPAQIHRATAVAGSIPWATGASQSDTGSFNKPPVPPAGQAPSQPQEQRQGPPQPPQGAPPQGLPPQRPLNTFTMNNESPNQGRSTSRWGASSTGNQEQNTPIGRPIPVVGSEREGGGSATPWQQAAAKGAQPPAEGDCMPGFVDPALPKTFMKILTRTVYVGGITQTISKEQVRDLFETIARVDTVTVNYPKFNAFVKLLTRAEAELIKERFHKYTWNGTMLKMGWGCGYGPKDLFDYASGETLFPIARMTDVEKRTISQSPRGGGLIEGGMVVEEPDFGWPQKGDICKGKYASGELAHAPGFLDAMAQRDRGGFNNAPTAPAAMGGFGSGNVNVRQNYLSPSGMPPRPPGPLPSYTAMGPGPHMGQSRMPYRVNPHGGIVVVTDRQYDDREDQNQQRWRPKQQQDRGEEHVVVLGGGEESDEDTRAKEGAGRDDGGAGRVGYDSMSHYPNGVGAGRMPHPGQFGYPPNPMMFGAYPMSARPPPHQWARNNPMMLPPYHHGQRPQWNGPPPQPQADYNQRKRAHSPGGAEDNRGQNEDRDNGDDGKRARMQRE